VKYLYGPVPSRRLGLSLGVDLVPHKVCSFDCIYCQLGRTTEKTTTRREYVPADKVLAEVKEFVDSGRKCDYITLSGSGEPTLNSKMGDIIKGIKALTDTPVAVLTNTSLITDARVREELSSADLVVPSLDAATQPVFERLNRPCSGKKVADIIVGLTTFTMLFEGEVWLEVMVVAGYNDTEPELMSLRHAIDVVKPDRVQLNTVVRPPAEEYAKPLKLVKLAEIVDVLGAEVIADFKEGDVSEILGDGEESILELLKRRPCTLPDISSALGLHENEVIKYLQALNKKRVVHSRISGKKKYYQHNGG
jgi:wyosine [tRNA(Phe)-imidazoG37] synthetase (radical SAM superfamily)